MSGLFQTHSYDNEFPDDFRSRSFAADEEEEDVNEEDIRKMAEALAPQMSELEDVLKDISATDDGELSSALELAETATRSMQQEDDDMDDELQQLAMSEQALREELEFAHSMNALLLSPSKDEGDSNDDYDRLAPATTIVADHSFIMMMNNTPTKELPSTKKDDPPLDRRPPANYSLQDHADYLQVGTEKMGGWYYCDMTSLLHGDMVETSQHLVKDYCLPIPFRKLKRLYSGLMYHESAPHSSKPLATPARNLLASPAPTTTTLVPSTPSTTTAETTTPSRSRISRVLTRTPAATTPATPATTTLAASTPPPPPPPPPPVPLHDEPLPVRTVAIRIRPDVLCGAVMDAVHHAFEILPSEQCTTLVSKRQGGHLRGAVYMSHKSLAYVVDAQLCTQKNDELERRLILRFYHVQDDPEAMHELGQLLHQKNKEKKEQENIGSETTGLDNNNDQSQQQPTEEDKNNEEANRHMKQACSLIQRLMAAQQQPGGLRKMEIKQQHSWLGLRDITAFNSEREMQATIASHLESNFKGCASVREENKKSSPMIRRLTLPSLSSKDWALLQVSWGLTNSIVDELDTRDCTYNTIATLPFGQFPSLPTLDVHYCSQLRRLSRENMINHLLRAAKDLEDYAKGAEYNCAICITLLEPMLKRYDIPPLELPKASKSLQEYPLDYTPPQVACPPWGTVVMEALNQIAAKTPTGDIDVLAAVQMVYDAFVKQDDEEQSARLGRKNAQIMDRLATLQNHQRAMVQTLRDAHVCSEKAASEATAFLKSAEKAVNKGGPGYPQALQPEVPLLSFKISQGASTSGTCYISASQMLFVTSYIPLVVTGSRSAAFDLDQLDFKVDESVPASLLNPFPNTMNVLLARTNQVLFSFRPTVSPTRLQKFLKVIQSFTNEERPSEFGEVVDNIIDAEQDADGIRISDTNSEGGLSV